MKTRSSIKLTPVAQSTNPSSASLNKETPSLVAENKSSKKSRNKSPNTPQTSELKNGLKGSTENQEQSNQPEQSSSSLVKSALKEFMNQKGSRSISRSCSPESKQIRIRLGSFVQKQTNIDAYLSRFAPKEKIGSGYYAEVFKLKGKEGECDRAMKVMNKNKIPFKEKEAFLREIELLKMLDHPNILKLYEFIEDDVNYYLITELCEGVELMEIIEKECESLTEKDIASIIQQVLSSLAYAHSNKIMHRDIKPENLMISKDESSAYRVKIVDWGMGSDYSKKDSTLNMKCGTSYYVAPEVIKKQYNQKCDIWSTGVILYTLLVQDVPFSGKSEIDIIQNVLKGKYEMDPEDWVKVSDDAKDLVKKMLTYQPTERIGAEEALKHPWFKIVLTNPKLNKTVLKMNIKRLQQFKAESQLQKAAMSFIVSHLLSDKDKEQYLKVFKQLDENGDGKLSKDEIKKSYQSNTGRVLSEDDIDQIFSEIDTDQNGFIDYTEFVTAVIDSSVFTEQEKLRNAFKLFDKDDDGFITSAEIQNVLGIDGIDIDAQTWNDIVAEVDENGDGQISFEEFCKIMKSLVQEKSNPRKKKQSVSKKTAADSELE